MARRRYVSTEISVDPRVCELAETYGAFAALLYTWMIPHSDDAGALSDDPRKLRMLVVPGLPQTTQDVADAIEGMVKLGLIEHHEDEHLIRFPLAAFTRYQSYINKARRDTAQNAADQRTSPQNASSSSFSSPVTSSFPVSDSVAETAPADAESPPQAPRDQKNGWVELTEEQRERADQFNARLLGVPGYEPNIDFLAKVVTKYAELDLDECAMAIASYAKSRPKAKPWPASTAAIRNWLAKELNDLHNPPERSPHGAGKNTTRAQPPNSPPISDEAREYLARVRNGAA